ncbi:MAG: hypothetical protein R3B57_13500 [Phycisphaerales bacterium]
MSALGEIRAMSPDDRYDLASSARAAERRNRPKHLLALSGAMLALGLLLLLVAWGSRAASARATANQERELEQIAKLSSEIVAKRRLVEEQEGGGDEGRIPDSRVRELAVRAGMTTVPPIAEVRTDSSNNAVRRRYKYAVKEESLEPMLEWVRLVLSEFRGAWVHEIEIKPSGRQWSLEVSFARWEQTS